MFSHTTIRHSYDFSQQIHEMAIEATQPQHEDVAQETVRREQEDLLTKFLKTIRETFYRS